ncbi:hypothetical protein [Devosia naphthalenivorans]|uniref:hypothetical protein n=1 Tax=Devosia naphthalenivorans TaxID=2082392 RepID=UPI000D34F4BE|nr:hypothetical protein [Devosia naphthalenivorans]
MQRITEDGLVKAGLATAGAAGGQQQRKLVRSERARQRAFNAECRRAQRLIENEHGTLGAIPTSISAMVTRAAVDPVFAMLFKEMQRLAQKWG